MRGVDGEVSSLARFVAVALVMGLVAAAVDDDVVVVSNRDMSASVAEASTLVWRDSIFFMSAWSRCLSSLVDVSEVASVDAVLASGVLFSAFGS